MPRKSLAALAFLAVLPAAMAGAAFAAETMGGDVLTGTAAFGGWEQNKPGVRRLITPSDLPEPYATQSTANSPGLTRMPAGATLTTLPGFKATLLATGFEQPRVVRTAPNGDLFVADSSANRIVVLRLDGSGKVAKKSVFASGLSQPYGIAFYPPGDNPQWVYVGNDGSIVRFPYKSGALKAAGRAKPVVPAFPPNHHWTRDIAFSPDGQTLYLALGSGSNVAEEVNGLPKGGIAAWAKSHALGEMWGDEESRGAVVTFKPDGSNWRVFATGLRNCSGLVIQPGTGDPWCVVNERDGLGDNLVPDFATHVAEGAWYGWPWYYIGNHEDPREPLKGQRPDLAGKATIPDVLFQAHSAPLNLAFYEGGMFPAEYRGDAFVTMHGSWNRGQPTGYKVVRLIFKNGKPTGAYEDFVTGFMLSDTRVWGRPVGVTVAADGALIVTEDGNGTIWRISYDGL